MHYSKHRTISIISKAAKIVLEIFGERVKTKVTKYAEEEQYGFRKDTSCIDQTIVVKLINLNKNLHIGFVPT